MTLTDLQAEVEARVHAMLPSALMEAALPQHMRNGFRLGCDCSYCSEKRLVTKWPFWNAEKRRLARERLAREAR